MQRILGPLTLACLLGSGACAQDIDCENAMTQMDMTLCAGQAFEEADADLNDAYGQARAAMQAMDDALAPPDRGADDALRKAQRAWVAFRDLACDAEGFVVRGGSMEQMMILTCLDRLTRQRAEDLWTLAEGGEG